MSQSAERKSHQCTDCRAFSPETDASYTLISAKFGWRLSRRVDDSGNLLLEWRCPKCWAKHKDARGLLRTPLDGVPASNAPLRENAVGWASGEDPPSSRRGDAPPSSGARAWDVEPPSTTRKKA